MKYKVPVQSLIDHIKTALDVDPWAKEMAEELLKEQETIVRCISCAFYRSDGECALHNGKWRPEGFCSWAICKEGRRVGMKEWIVEECPALTLDGKIVSTMLRREQELIRCRDCKNADYGTDEDGNRFMKCIGSVKCYGGTTPDFFCADGEART